MCKGGDRIPEVNGMGSEQMEVRSASYLDAMDGVEDAEPAVATQSPGPSLDPPPAPSVGVFGRWTHSWVTEFMRKVRAHGLSAASLPEHPESDRPEALLRQFLEAYQKESNRVGTDQVFLYRIFIKMFWRELVRSSSPRVQGT